MNRFPTEKPLVFKVLLCTFAPINLNPFYMNRYETVFIMTPVLSAEQVAETVEKYKAFLKEHKGIIVHEEAWGLRKLAYPIQKKINWFLPVAGV